MVSNWHPAPDALAPVLAGIWSVRAGDDGPLAARVLPDGSSSLVFQRGGTVLRTPDVGHPWAAMSLSGPRTRPFDFTLDAAGRILIVQLRPAGAGRVLDVPMSSLADRYEELDAVVGAVPTALIDHVSGDPDDLAAVRAIERWLSARVRATRRPHAASDAAVREIVDRAGGVRVEDLAEHVNLSRRHLGRIMSERVGFPTKLFARITRFDHAVRLGRRRPRVPWAQIALEAGYADQAHLTREFAELGGIRPTDLRGPAAAMIW